MITRAGFGEYILQTHNTKFFERFSGGLNPLTSSLGTPVLLIVTFAQVHKGWGIQGGPKNWHTLFCTSQLRQILTDFQTYFTLWIRRTFCNNIVTKNPTTSQVCRYTTLWNVSVLKATIENKTTFCLAKSVKSCMSAPRPVASLYSLSLVNVHRTNTWIIAAAR